MNKVKEFLDQAKGKLKTAALPATALFATAIVMSPMVYASDGGGSSGGMSAILGSIDTIVSLMGRVWDVMTSNALLCLYLAVGLLMVGIKVFRRIKSAAK